VAKPIPIRNLWFLLSYAHGLARFNDKQAVAIGEHDDVPELLARLLATMVERRIFHCHVLSHEDADMTAIIRVRPAPRTRRSERA
jgi:FtsP/CotA-like multicopper oxidase with cupredoxin domain